MDAATWGLVNTPTALIALRFMHAAVDRRPDTTMAMLVVVALVYICAYVFAMRVIDVIDDESEVMELTLALILTLSTTTLLIPIGFLAWERFVMKYTLQKHTVAIAITALGSCIASSCLWIPVIVRRQQPDWVRAWFSGWFLKGHLAFATAAMYIIVVALGQDG